MKIWHVPQPIHSQDFSRFKLCAILDREQDKTSLSNPIFPVPSSLPSKLACITGNFGDLPLPQNTTTKPWGCCQQMRSRYSQELLRDPLQDQGQGGIQISSWTAHPPQQCAEDTGQEKRGETEYISALLPSLPSQEAKGYGRTQHQSSP